MKAVSPLSLEPKDLPWLLEEEESMRAAAQSSCGCAIWLLSGFLCSLPLHCALSLSQPDSLPTQWMSLEWLV